MNVKLRDLFRHQIDNNQMSRIRITDQEPSRQLDMLAFFMLHMLIFVFMGMFILILVSVLVLVVFIFAVTVNVNEWDRVYVFRNLKQRIVVRRGIMDQFLQPQPL